MGAALVQGLLRTHREASDVVIVETSEARRGELATMFPKVHITAALSNCSEAIIAVKPADAPNACKSAVAAGALRVVSIAAGVRLTTLQAACGDSVRVLRAMPNTPALVGLAATAISASSSCTAEDRTWAKALLGSVGIVIEVDEPMLDAFTGLVGSGPAYLFYVAEALQTAAHDHGFDESTSAAIVAQLFVGTAALLQREPGHARELRERVTSPKGTTAAGVELLDERQVRAAVIAAVLAATQRSKELGDA